MQSDIITWTILNNLLNNFKTDNVITNVFLLFLIPLILNYTKDIKKIIKKYCDLYNHSQIISINMTTSDEDISIQFSKKYKAFCWWVSKYPTSDIRKWTEINNYGWCEKEERRTEIFSLLQPNQIPIFEVYQKNQVIDRKIFAKIHKEEKEKKLRGEEMSTQITNIDIFLYSNKLEYKKHMDYLLSFIDNMVKEYLEHQSHQPEQLYIQINKTDPLIFKWNSNATFNNTFFFNNKEFLKKINIFLENKEYYKKCGKNHTLGILLSGPPGTGKTTFINCLANKTKRHLVQLNLGKNSDPDVINEIINGEKIGDLIIKPKNKIIIIEEADTTDIFKQRNLKDGSEQQNSNLKSEFEEFLNLANDKNKKNKKKFKSNQSNSSFSLGDWLKIVDGLQNADERMVLLTTNKPEEFDEAVLRKGRIDIHIKFGFCSKETIYNMLLYHYFEDKQEINKISFDKIKDKYDNSYPCADIKDLFMSNNFKEIKELLFID